MENKNLPLTNQLVISKCRKIFEIRHLIDRCDIAIFLTRFHLCTSAITVYRVPLEAHQKLSQRFVRYVFALFQTILYIPLLHYYNF